VQHSILHDDSRRVEEWVHGCLDRRRMKFGMLESGGDIYDPSWKFNLESTILSRWSVFSCQ
jgi:hypothetical protein